MTKRVFVDTNVFIYARDRRVPGKQPQAERELRAPPVSGRRRQSASCGGVPQRRRERAHGPLDDRDVRATLGLIELWSAGQTSIELIEQA